MKMGGERDGVRKNQRLEQKRGGGYLVSATEAAVTTKGNVNVVGGIRINGSKSAPAKKGS